MRRTVLAALLPLALAAAASAAPALTAERAVDPAAYRTLDNGGLLDVTLVTEDNETLVLELERFNPFSEDARVVRVDQHGFEHPIDLSADVHLRGTVAQDPDRLAYLNITEHGTRGFVSAGDTKALMITNEHGTLRAVRVNDLNLPALDTVCRVDINDPEFNPFGVDTTPIPMDTQQLRGADNARLAKVAVETDYEFSAAFSGNTTASAAYASSLLSAISTIYASDVNMELQISYLRTYETNNDPYGGSDIGRFLERVQSEFNSGDEANIDRAIVQGLSTRNLGGGVAWLATACSDYWGIGVSANLNASFPDPIRDNSNSNWDLIVVAHEMGHNFGTGHTHDSYSPVIDGCGNGDCGDARDATIMSYCHLCAGGLSNIDLRFHPRVQDRIIDYVSTQGSCIEIIDQTCPADLTGDGAVDFADVSEFLNLLPDLTNDAQFDFADVAMFLQLFAQGCP